MIRNEWRCVVGKQVRKRDLDRKREGGKERGGWDRGGEFREGVTKRGR